METPLILSGRGTRTRRRPHDTVSEEDKKDTQVTSQPTRNPKSLTDDWGAQEAGRPHRRPPRAGWVCVSGGGGAPWTKRANGSTDASA